MLLKKQTVWLLTMLSLVVVLSIYYITSPEQTNDVAQEENGSTNETSGQIAGDSTDETIITEAAGDEVFAQLRYELELKRSQQMEELQTQAASAELSAEEVNAVKEEMDKLENIAYKEDILRTEIIAMGFEDALVRAEDGKVHITVKGNEPSPSLANDILVMVAEQLGQEFEPVAVEFTPAE
ncbi:SpoIIIAH-like family protein [Bacillus litorisediminis]|uniref:SpoIIIAH-like family protein n=1 Tax=Bacillus litorisediminis TaxID=2922713 RepID=UPI001FACA488|nr:SpoIIIAH-like family protein [Bacillus litorisediminis]